MAVSGRAYAAECGIHVEDARKHEGCALSQTPVPVDHPLEVIVGERLDGPVLPTPSVHDEPAREGARVESRWEHLRLVDQAGEIHDFDGGADCRRSDDALCLSCLPGLPIRGVGDAEGGDGLLLNVQDLVLVGEADQGRQLVDGEIATLRFENASCACPNEIHAGVGIKKETYLR